MTEPAGGATPDELAADIAVQRERLAADLDELSARLDVRTRSRQYVQDRVARVRRGAVTRSGAPHPALLAAAGAVLLLAAAAVRRRRAD